MPKLDFLKNYTLEDERVKLIPLDKEHISALSLISEDPEIWMYFFEKGNSLGELTDYVAKAVQEREVKKAYPFVVFDKIKQEFAGTTRFFEYSDELNTIRLGHTWYGKAYRGTGLNKHCKYLLFQFAFEELDIERIGFGAYADNTISIAAMKSVGCSQESILRNMFPALHGSGRTDAILMGILKEEWREGAKEKLQKRLQNT